MGDDLTVLRWLSWAFVGLCLVWPVSARAQAATKGLRAERFDVRMTLLPDGSVDVNETVVFRFTEKTFTTVEREVPIGRFDGVIDVRASLDGRLLAADGVGERARIRQGRRTLRVTWTFPKTIDQARAFTLEYRAMGALAVTNGRASLDWILLPSRHRYVIDKARVEWRAPASAVRLVPTALDDPRWTSSAMPDGWAAERDGVGIDETVVMTDAFEAASLAVTVPVWQNNAERARQMAPAFVIGALTLLVMGAGVLGMTWFRYHQPATEAGEASPASAHALPPAMGTALVRDAVGIGLGQMQATLLDLARRGILDIRETPDDPKRFELGMPSTPRVRPHEQVITDSLWLRLKSGRADLKTSWQHMTQLMPAFQRSVLEELQQAGLVDGERRSAARHMTTAGVVVMLFGLVGVGIFAVLFGHFGALPLLVPGAVMISGIAFLIAGQVMSRLSPAGRVQAAAWRARRAWLKVALTSPMSPGDVEQWFAVAAGFGLTGPMLKASQGHGSSGVAAFKWLGELRDPNAALAVIIATTSASAHHSGGGGGAAAGGGSSSAH